ncbi:hypothetical protein GLOTRDRAFT_112572 [Gloeophyllum trabeum ATCC 11539]|uniref:Uncharacterized protein n=1 Tax=Gloeophyllum trabeum (strain ATCC 11539 / FP-39264 / Madison 617) TaxID=670483 RepID=S7PTP4_GLOTA|nr:uncharacterized protein GLOTRDRAFT_112572 [Gloeophyllum trabeum ATCC 11539]EPQ51156.1 hypothetical protein GLOTRDRAFT_112572 [Gloeophyllum trabeum ATCC 11539]
MLENMTVDWIGTSCSARLVEKMLESRARLDDDAGVPRLKSAQVIQNWTNGFHHKRHDWTIQGSGEIKHSGYTKTPWRIDNF